MINPLPFIVKKSEIYTKLAESSGVNDKTRLRSDFKNQYLKLKIPMDKMMKIKY